MCDGNYIKLNRKMLEWEWYTDANTSRVFIHCLIKANWKDGRFKGADVPRGSFVSSSSIIASELKLTRQQVRTAIIHLISTNELTKSGTSTYTIFTVVKYDKYQEINQVSNQQVTNEQPTSNQRVTNEQPTSNQRVTTIEERKKERRKEKTYSDLPELQKAIEDFIAHRKQIKSPMTERAVQLMLTKLDKLAPDADSKIAILEQSIEQGWKGIFEIKLKQQANNKFNSFHQSQDSLDDIESSLIRGN